MNDFKIFIYKFLENEINEDYQNFVDSKEFEVEDEMMNSPEEKSKQPKIIPGNINIRELFFDYLAHGKLLEEENDIKDLKKRK